MQNGNRKINPTLINYSVKDYQLLPFHKTLLATFIRSNEDHENFERKTLHLLQSFIML